jgi:hypothetical protein
VKGHCSSRQTDGHGWGILLSEKVQRLGTSTDYVVCMAAAEYITRIVRRGDNPDSW